MLKPRTIGEYQGRPTRAPRVRDPKMERLRTSSRYQHIARSFLHRHPICEICDQYNRLTPSECLDHIIPWRGDTTLFWDPDNWQALCNRCHGQKGIKELTTTYRAIEGRYVVTGKRGSGKTTWVDERAQSGDVVWDLDVVAHQHGYGDYPRTESQMLVLYSIRDHLIDALVDNAEPCYLIIHDRIRAGLYAHRLGAKVVVIDCGEDKRRRRLVDRDVSIGGGGAFDS